MKLFRLTLDELPIMGAVRMTQSSKYKSAPAQRYLAWKAELGYLLRAQMVALGYTEPWLCDVEVTIVVATATPPDYDVDNMGKAVLDAANKIVWKDDKQVKRLVIDVGHQIGETDSWSVAITERLNYRADLDSEGLPF